MCVFKAVFGFLRSRDLHFDYNARAYRAWSYMTTGETSKESSGGQVAFSGKLAHWRVLARTAW